MIVIIQGNKGKKIGSSSIINTKRCRGAETQETIYPDHTNVIIDHCSYNYLQYDTSLNQSMIRDSAFTPANWLLYSVFIVLPLGWGLIGLYSRRVPIMKGPNNSINTGLKVAIIGFAAAMFAVALNELWQFWFVEEITAVPPRWIFTMGVFVGVIGSLAYLIRTYARLIELGAEIPVKNPHMAEMYKLALEGKLYSRIIP